MREGVMMTEQEISTHYAENFNAACGAIADFDKALSGHNFRSNLKHTIVLGLAQRLLEFSRGSETMGRSGLAAANAAMGRMCIETVFKLKAICLGTVSPEDYAKQELVAEHQSLKRAMGLPNLSEIFTIEQQTEYHEKLQQIEQELGRKVKLHEIKLSDWADKAGETRTYALVYSSLSDYVHSGASSLSHIMEVRQQGQVFIQTGPSTHQLASMLQGICTCLAIAQEAIDNMFTNEAQ